METKACFGTEAGWFVKEINLTNVNWKSTNSNIATVDNNGKVTGIAQGNTTITAQVGNYNCEYNINVIPYSQNNSYSKHNYFTILIVSLIVIVLISIILLITVFKKKNK